MSTSLEYGNHRQQKRARVVRRPPSHHIPVTAINTEVKFDTRCSPWNFACVVEKHVLPDCNKIKVLENVGFGELLKISKTDINHELCRWICVHFDYAYSRIEVGRSKELITFNASDVYQILGLPRGDKPVNMEVGDIDIILAEMGLVSTERCVAPWENILQFVKQDRADDIFVRAFIIYAMSVLLNTTTRREMNLKILRSLRDCSQIKEMNWCEFVYKSTVKEIQKWRCGRGKKRTRIKYVGGSVYILMVWYLHKTYIEGFNVPVKFPISRVWDKNLVTERLLLELKLFGQYGVVEARPSDPRPTNDGQNNIFCNRPNQVPQNQIPAEDLPSSSSDPFAKLYSHIASIKEHSDVIMSSHTLIMQHMEHIEIEMNILKDQDHPQPPVRTSNTSSHYHPFPTGCASNQSAPHPQSPSGDSNHASPPIKSPICEGHMEHLLHSQSPLANVTPSAHTHSSQFCDTRKPSQANIRMSNDIRKVATPHDSLHPGGSDGGEQHHVSALFNRENTYTSHNAPIGQTSVERVSLHTTEARHGDRRNKKLKGKKVSQNRNVTKSNSIGSTSSLPVSDKDGCLKEGSKEDESTFHKVSKRRVIRSAAIKSPFLPTLQSKTKIPTSAMKKYLDLLEDPNFSSSDIVCSMFDVQLSKADLQTLAPKCWVNSVVVEMYCHVFNHRVDSNGKPSGKIYITPSQSNAMVTGALSIDSMDEVRNACGPILRQFSRRQLNSVEMMFFPICDRNHWFVIVGNIRDSRFDYLDCRNSDRKLPGQTKILINLGVAMRYMMRKAKHPKQDVAAKLERQPGEVPKTKTNDDCGLWAIAYMDLWDGRMTSQLDIRRVEDYRLYYMSSLLAAESNEVRSKFVPTETSHVGN